MSGEWRVLRCVLCLGLWLSGCVSSVRVVCGADRPNIVWISCEDISPLLGCYGESGARTPRLDRLASEGILWTRAFSCHGVCAPSRTGIITARHPISLGANHMRSRVQLPAGVRLFPELLREAGYYCTNNSKTDYNVVRDLKLVWDESSGRAHWRNRRDSGQPFFAVFNLTMTHESKVWPEGWRDVVRGLGAGELRSADSVFVPPLYPDTAGVRGDFARLSDLIAVMDREVGRLLDELEAAGLADETIVMFWSDHGNGLPRAKRWIYDSGVRVPLIVRIPERYREWSGGGLAGSREDGLVSLLDLGPTVLSLAGVPIPEGLAGQPLLGPGRSVVGRRYLHGARDRLDERQDLVRAVRSERYRYVRNLMPWYPALQEVSYGERNETLREWRRLGVAGGLTEAQAQWLRPRQAEELYDLESDPWELRNLAGDVGLLPVLEELRGECDRWQLAEPDVQLLPEAMLERESAAAGVPRGELFAGAAGRVRLERVLRAAEGASRGAGVSVGDWSAEPDAAVRWWHLEGVVRRLSAGVVADAGVAELLRVAARDVDPVVRLSAAGGLARLGEGSLAAEVCRGVLGESGGDEILLTAVMRVVDESGSELFGLLRGELAGHRGGEYFDRLFQHSDR
ncbi:MAG: sulfatase-like hydrolase/transferase [Planctomycetaceae bacterium]